MNANLIFLCFLAVPEVPHASMPLEFMGEPKTIAQMRIDDVFWVPAHCLTVDKDGKCWLDPKQKLDEKSDHKLKVMRKKIKGQIVYTVYIHREWLLGWRWKKTSAIAENLIPVACLNIGG